MSTPSPEPPAPPTPQEKSLFTAPWFNMVARFAVLLLIFVVFDILTGGAFHQPRNLEGILRQSAVYTTAALGMTMVIITAGIDLSIGSIIAVAVVVVAWTMKTGYDLFPPPPDYDPEGFDPRYDVVLPLTAVFLGVVAATLSGMFNGAVIVGLRLPPFIVTLGSMGIIRGVGKLIASERDIYPKYPSWLDANMDPTLVPFADWLFGDGPQPPWPMGFLVLPLGVWIMLIGAVVAAFLLRYTRFGRHVYAIGSNEETARLCGVPVGRTKIMVYGLAGFFAGLAGLMQFSYIGGIGQPTTAIAYELFVIAAVVVGGASLMGGEGSILGSVIGALIITVLYMGGQQAGWDKPWQEIMIGGIIIIAVALDQVRRAKLT